MEWTAGCESQAPWGWECECGLLSEHTSQFCWSCGKPATGGTPVALNPQSAPQSALETDATTSFGALQREVDTLDEDPVVQPAVLAPTVLRAPLRVVDAAGRTLLSLDGLDEGPVLRLFNLAGEAAVCIGVTPDGGAITVSSGDGPPQVMLLSTPTGGYVGVTHPDGRAAAELRAERDG